MADDKRREGAYSGTAVHDATADNLDFSIDSLQLGDSTRSLLSPLYEKKDISLKEQRSSSPDSSVDEEQAANAISKHTDLTYSECSFEDSDSDNVTVKKRKEKSARSSRTSSFCSSASVISSSSSTPHKADSRQDIEPQLSPWEKWLLAKVIEEDKKAKGKAKKQLLERESEDSEIRSRMEKEKMAEANRKRWLQLKNEEERLRNRIARQEARLKAEEERLKNVQMEELSEESFKNWTELKNIERTEKQKERSRNERMRRKEARDRKEKSEDAYQKWLEKAKRQPKATNNHFGYLSGRITGYYDWTCYPMPTYTNPVPWVAPKIKKQPHPGKTIVQCASPPLLFKELELREERQKNTRNKRSRKNSCK